MGREKDLHFNVTELDAFIEASGVTATIYAALRCPCASEDSEQPDPLCDYCYGLGWQYDSDLTLSTRVLLTSDQFNKKFEAPGSWTTGHVNCTTQSDVLLSDRDKVVPQGERVVANDELLTKGAQSLRGRSLEVLRFSGVERVLSLRGLTRAFTEGTDWELSGRQVLWLPGGSAPSEGERYAVRYVAQAEYVVWASQPRVRVENDAGLPWFAQLMRLDVYWRQQPMDGAS